MFFLDKRSEALVRIVSVEEIRLLHSEVHIKLDRNYTIVKKYESPERAKEVFEQISNALINSGYGFELPEV